MPEPFNRQGRRLPPPPRAVPTPPNLIYPIPADTRTAFDKFRADGKQCRNLGLLFERYIGYLPEWRLDDKRTSPKKDALKHIAETPVERELLDAYIVRWRARTREAVVLEGNPQWRFLTGLGGKGPLEVGFTFHSLYGVPIIPGSALKGLTRAFTLLAPDQVSEIAGQRIEERECDPLFLHVFGSQNAHGHTTFFDAIPAEPPTFELDVMNPHYPDYYQSKAPPANWQSPQPVFFLTLGAKSKFLFAVGGAEQERVAAWLVKALADMGVGAKTSAGYGYWNVGKT
jgi:CRISPR-associated protein Cmr6